MKQIPTKIGLELLIPLNLIFLSISYRGILEKHVPAIPLGIMPLIFINYLLFVTKYFIDGNILIIKSLLQNINIPVEKITKIEKTWNPLSFPAPILFGRVEIYFDHQSIIISQKSINELKRDLLKINPNIILK